GSLAAPRDHVGAHLPFEQIRPRRPGGRAEAGGDVAGGVPGARGDAGALRSLAGAVGVRARVAEPEVAIGAGAAGDGRVAGAAAPDAAVARGGAKIGRAHV